MSPPPSFFRVRPFERTWFREGPVSRVTFTVAKPPREQACIE